MTANRTAKWAKVHLYLKEAEDCFTEHGVRKNLDIARKIVIKGLRKDTRRATSLAHTVAHAIDDMLAGGGADSVTLQERSIPLLRRFIKREANLSSIRRAHKGYGIHSLTRDQILTAIRAALTR